MKPKELTKLSGMLDDSILLIVVIADIDFFCAARSTKATEVRDKAQADYRRVLQFTNQQKTIFWCQEMPAVLRKYQTHEEERVEQTKGIVEKLGHAFLFKPPIYQSSAEALIRAADAIDKKADVKALVEKHGSGYSAPGDYPEQHFGGDTGHAAPSAFEDTSAVLAAASASSSTSAAPPATPAKTRGGKPPPLPSKAGIPGSGDVLARCGGLSSLAADLTNAAKAEQLAEQLDALEKAMAHETKAKSGLEALIGFYKDDPVAKKKAEVEVADAASKLQAIGERVKKIEGELKTVSGGSDARARGTTVVGATPASNLPTIERLQALFDYDATSEQELTFKEGDWLEIKQKDDSGWWWAALGSKQGFVPNSYVVPE
jgi:hypothetical protein